MIENNQIDFAVMMSKWLSSLNKPLLRPSFNTSLHHGWVKFSSHSTLRCAQIQFRQHTEIDPSLRGLVG